MRRGETFFPLSVSQSLVRAMRKEGLSVNEGDAAKEGGIVGGAGLMEAVLSEAEAFSARSLILLTASSSVIKSSCD